MSTALWQVWRQDDNGNRFLVEAYREQRDAEALVARLTRTAHKQCYWISRQGDTAGEERGDGKAADHNG
jgi:hypothetical protein